MQQCTGAFARRQGRVERSSTEAWASPYRTFYNGMALVLSQLYAGFLFAAAQRRSEPGRAATCLNVSAQCRHPGNRYPPLRGGSREGDGIDGLLFIHDGEGRIRLFLLSWTATTSYRRNVRTGRILRKNGPISADAASAETYAVLRKSRLILPQRENFRGSHPKQRRGCSRRIMKAPDRMNAKSRIWQKRKPTE